MEHRNQKTPRARTRFALRISLRGVFSDCLFAFCFGGLTLLSAGRRVVCRGRTDFPFFLPSINSCRALFGRAVRACRQRSAVADGECASHPATGGVEFRAGCQPTTPPAFTGMVSFKTAKPRLEQVHASGVRLRLLRGLPCPWPVAPQQSRLRFWQHF